MARTLTDDEIKMLLAMPETEANAWIDEHIDGMLDSMDAKAALIKRRQYSADAPIPGFDTTTALAGLGIGAGVSAVAAARLAELIKGSTTTYAAVLDPVVIRQRLRTVLGPDYGVFPTSGEIVVTYNDRSSAEFCRILVANNDDKTSITVSGLNLDEVKRGADNVVDGLLNLGKRALGGRNVEGALDVFGRAVETARQAGSDLLAANTIADTIEKYGAEAERQAAEAARKAAVEKAEAEERDRKEKYCSHCGTARPSGSPCPNCGASE